MTAVLLPATFHNSFWSQDCFRTGLSVLFERLEEGCAEDREIIALIDAQAKAYYQISESLSTLPPAPTISSPTASTTSATLSLTFSSLQSSLTSQSEVYHAAGIALKSRVVDAFAKWQGGHEGRVKWAVEEFLGDLDGKRLGGRDGDPLLALIPDYERRCAELQKLKQTYVSKTRTAEDLEEDVRFAPLTSPSTKSSTAVPRSLPLPQGPTNANGRLSPLPASPRMARIIGHDRSSSLTGDMLGGGGVGGSPGRNVGLARQGTVADRINEKLRAASIVVSPKEGSPVQDSPSKAQRQSLDMAFGVGRSQAKRPALPDKSEDVLGLSFESLISLLSRFGHYLAVSEPPTPNDDSSLTSQATSGSSTAKPSRTRRGLVGPVENTFTGTELVAWLLENVKALGEDWDRGEKGGKELWSMGMVERVGVRGKGQWEGGSDAFYILKDAVLDASPFAIEALRTQYNLAKGNTDAVQPAPHHALSPSMPSLAIATSLVKSYIPTTMSALAAVTGSSSPSSEAPHVRARREAKAADERYADAVEELDLSRLRLEERIEQGLKIWEKWERERTDVVKQVLKQYEGIMTNVPVGLKHGIEAMQVAVTAYKPEADITAMIETLRTGDFRPTPHVYENIESDEPVVGFGIDLRKQLGWKAARQGQDVKAMLPPALEAMLQGLAEIYPDLPHDQRRKAWIYIVDLRESHALREALNDARIPVAEMIKDVKRFNAPVIAATVKLWLLELDPPVVDYSVYQSLKSMSTAEHKSQFEMAALEGLKRLAGPQILVLDAVLSHLRQLIDSTQSAEANSTFMKKLSLSMGRMILRPHSDTELTLQDRTPSRFFSEMLENYEQIFAPLVERANAEQSRPVPQRKRTKPTDLRITRRSLGSEDSQDHGRELLEQQISRQHPKSVSPREASGLPPILASPISAKPAAGFPNLDMPPTSRRKHDEEIDVRDVSQPSAHSSEQEPSRPRTPEQRIPVNMSLGSPLPASSSGRRNGAASDMSTDDEQRAPRLNEDRALSDEQTTVKRVQSNEGVRLVRGPRTTRGPRVAPNKAVSHSSSSPASDAGAFSPTHAPRQNSIKDRIAQLEGAKH